MNEYKISLIKNAIKGDKYSLETLIKEEQHNVYATLYYLKKNDEDINDIMQDIFIKLSCKIKQLKNPQYFKTWLNQIVINSYYDYLRKSRRQKNNLILDKIDSESSFEIPDLTDNPQDKILKSELDYIIKNSIQNLPVHYKIPITLREIQGLSYYEISNITNTSLGTVKSRISRARSIIKDDIVRYTKD